MVLWVTGLSGSGKTTLCKTLYGLLKPSLPELVVIDSEEVRNIFGGQLGYSVEERVIQLKRVQRLVSALVEQNLVVIVAALYAAPEILSWNRENFDEYYEVYLDAPLSVVKGRDPKGLYAKADRGEESNVIGIDIPWVAPVNPDLVVDVTQAGMPAEIADLVARRVPEFSRVIGSGSS
jgi:adenylylsulfate kinase-like enzyme